MERYPKKKQTTEEAAADWVVSKLMDGDGRKEEGKKIFFLVLLQWRKLGEERN
jgi:hypothetical protein